MPVDAPIKRGSAIAIGKAAPRIEPYPPVGSIPQTSRQCIAYCYAGIAAGVPIVTFPRTAKLMTYPTFDATLPAFTTYVNNTAIVTYPGTTTLTTTDS